jgi:hypothetical protein
MSTYLSPSPGSYNSSNNARTVGNNQRSNIYYQGQNLQDEEADQGNQYGNQRSQTADYLNNIEDPIAQGNGGYNASETSQIEMTPEQQQQMVDQAGISAGAATQANNQQANAATAATGGNPLAAAAYGQRAALQSGNQAGDAMTNARVAASNAAATREENIGQTRLGQQDQALGYYQGQNTQANSDEQNEQALQNQTYGTETSGTNQAANTQLSASQTPSTFDKILGAASGALSYLEDGGDGATAVIGEAGPEKVIDMRYMDAGGVTGDGDDVQDQPETPNAGNPSASGSSNPQPWWKSIGHAVASATKPMASPQQNVIQPQQQAWNPTTPYTQLGSGIGQAVSNLSHAGYLADGGMPTQGANGIFTKPTAVKLKPYEGVVPLTHRPGAKFRPNMASMPPAKVNYGGMHG